MKINSIALGAVALAASFVLGRGDVKIAWSQVPTAVQQSVMGHIGSNKIIRVEKADEGGKTQYEVLTRTANDRKIEFIVNPDGTLDSTEEPLKVNELPAGVTSTIQKAVAGGKLDSVERVTKDGTVTYEAGYQSGHGAMEAVVSADGKLMKNGVDND